MNSNQSWKRKILNSNQLNSAENIDLVSHSECVFIRRSQYYTMFQIMLGIESAIHFWQGAKLTVDSLSCRRLEAKQILGDLSVGQRRGNIQRTTILDLTFKKKEDEKKKEKE